MWGLLLLAPVPSLAVLAALVLGKGSVGVAVWVASKAWMLVFPVLWQRTAWRIEPPTTRDVAVGAATGLGIAAVITSAYVLGQPMIDPAAIRAALAPTGLLSPWMYAVVAAYWVLINSAMEEVVYRWFLFTQSRRLVGTGAAVLMSALFFVAHHAIALSIYFDVRVAVVGSLGVFAGGVIWSALFLAHRNLWASILSHAIADVAVFAIGAVLLFA